MRTWDAPTLARFLDLVRNDRHQPAWLFLATTGCRRGEALGVRWADVDLDGGKVALRQTISAIAHEMRLAPRTKSGKPRPIEIDKTTIAALRAVRVRQAEERLLVGPTYDDHDLVFARPDGQPQHPEHFSNAFERRVARYKLPRIRLHDLRHTWATLALSAGVDVKIVSERLGHASAKITWDIYQHVTPTMQADAAETVARLIFGTDVVRAPAATVRPTLRSEMSTPQPEPTPNESLELPVEELLRRGRPHPPYGEQVIDDLTPEEAEAFLAAVLS